MGGDGTLRITDDLAQMTVVLPSVSMAGSRRITAQRLAIRAHPDGQRVVTAAGSPSGCLRCTRSIENGSFWLLARCEARCVTRFVGTCHLCPQGASIRRPRLQHRDAARVLRLHERRPFGSAVQRPESSRRRPSGMSRTSVMAWWEVLVTSTVHCASSTRSPGVMGMRPRATRTKPAIVV